MTGPGTAAGRTGAARLRAIRPRGSSGSRATVSEAARGWHGILSQEDGFARHPLQVAQLATAVPHWRGATELEVQAEAAAPRALARMSAICSSIQSPGSREVTISLSPEARRARDSGDMVSAE